MRRKKRTVAGRILVRKRGKVVLVPLDNLVYVSASGNDLELRLENGRHLVRATFGDVEPLLDGRFRRIHRSTIVNLDHVVELRPRPSGTYDVILANGEVLSLSRTFRDALLDHAL